MCALSLGLLHPWLGNLSLYLEKWQWKSPTKHSHEMPEEPRMSWEYSVYRGHSLREALWLRHPLHPGGWLLHQWVLAFFLEKSNAIAIHSYFNQSRWSFLFEGFSWAKQLKGWRVTYDYVDDDCYADALSLVVDLPLLFHWKDNEKKRREHYVSLPLVLYCFSLFYLFFDLKLHLGMFFLLPVFYFWVACLPDVLEYFLPKNACMIKHSSISTVDSLKTLSLLNLLPSLIQLVVLVLLEKTWQWMNER